MRVRVRLLVQIHPFHRRASASLLSDGIYPNLISGVSSTLLLSTFCRGEINILKYARDFLSLVNVEVIASTFHTSSCPSQSNLLMPFLLHESHHSSKSPQDANIFTDEFI
jgi:hypothetical protein